VHEIDWKAPAIADLLQIISAFRVSLDQCITLIAEAEFEEQTRSVIKVIQYERETL